MTDALTHLRKLAEAATPAHPWTCHCDVCCSYINGKRQLERALPLLLDLVEAADKMRRWASNTTPKALASVEVSDYDDKRAALAQAVGK